MFVRLGIILPKLFKMQYFIWLKLLSPPLKGLLLNLLKLDDIERVCAALLFVYHSLVNAIQL